MFFFDVNYHVLLDIDGRHFFMGAKIAKKITLRPILKNVCFLSPKSNFRGYLSILGSQTWLLYHLTPSHWLSLNITVAFSDLRSLELAEGEERPQSTVCMVIFRGRRNLDINFSWLSSSDGPCGTHKTVCFSSMSTITFYSTSMAAIFLWGQKSQKKSPWDRF